MYGILDRYVGKNIILSVLLVAVCLTLFAGLVNLIDSLRLIGRGEVNFSFLVRYIILKLPSLLVTFFPVSILIGGVVGLGAMARNSEIVILQSIGLSKFNIGISCVKSIIPLILIVMVIAETVAPRLDKRAEEEYYKKSAAFSGLALTSKGVWFKENNLFLGICALLNGRTVLGVAKYEYDGTKLISLAKARSGVYVKDHWLMEDVHEQLIEDDRIVYRHHVTQEWPLSVNIKRIEVLNDMSDNLSTRQLYDYIKYIEKNNVDSSNYRLALFGKIFSPLVMLVMLLLALSTIFGPLRQINMGARILAGITLGFGYYVLNQIVAPFSLVYGIPPILGASLSTIVFALLAVYLLMKKS